MSDAIDDPELLRAKINLETARVAWKSLQRLCASGHVLAVADDLDLVEVALQMSLDRRDAVAVWLEREQLQPVTDDQARSWFRDDAELWAVVVKPFVLVQQRE